MPKQNFQEASSRSVSRRAHGAETHNPLNNKTQTSLGYGGWVSELTAYCDEHALLAVTQIRMNLDVLVDAGAQIGEVSRVEGLQEDFGDEG